MNNRALECASFRITPPPGLDPITVVLFDFERGRGQIIVECYGHAWSAYRGAIAGGKSITEYVATSDAERLAELLVSGLQRPVKRTEENWVKRIAPHVIAACKAGAA